MTKQMNTKLNKVHKKVGVLIMMSMINILKNQSEGINKNCWVVSKKNSNREAEYQLNYLILGIDNNNNLYKEINRML